MALKYRKEIVGKRIVALKRLEAAQTQKHAVDNLPPPDLTTTSWITGTVRASTEIDIQNNEIQVLIEVDNTDWQKRDWFKVHEDFSAFFVEDTLVLTQKPHPKRLAQKCWWPALKFRGVVDEVGVGKSKLQPVESLVEQKLSFLPAERIRDYWESSCSVDPEGKQAAVKWTEYQDGQRILVSTPTVLLGFRVKVYRKEGTTQWFTAVIQQYNNDTKELSLLDDTVLEERLESPQLTQIIPLDGVVESILTGAEARVAPRRRACKETANKDQSGSNKSTAAQITQASPANRVGSTSAESATAVSRGLSQSISLTDESKSLRGRRPSATASKRRQSDSATRRQSIKLKHINSDTSAVRPTTTVTSVVRQAAQANRRLKSSPGSKSQRGEDQRSRKQAARKSKSSLDRESVSGEDVTGAVASPAANSAPAILTDMHIKKQRILGAVSDTNIPTTSQSDLVSGDDRSAITDNNVTSHNNSISVPPPPSVSNSPAAQYSGQRVDKRSDGSVDGGSSGYSSAATTESTVSPREKDGQKSSHLVRTSMSSLSRFSNTVSAPPLSSTEPHSVASNYSSAKYPSSTSVSSNRLRPDSNSDTSSPLVIDTNKESPLVPYRDPELLKRDAEVRKMAHTPSSSQPPPHQSVPTTRSLPTAPAGGSNVPSLPQAALPTAAAAMLNPQMAQQFNMQIMQQYQLMEQYRQLQAMQNLNPLQMSLLQQQAVQHQLALGLYERQTRAPGLPAAAAAAPWMMMPGFNDKPLVNDLQREQELRALDQKERVERAEREKAAKEKAEKERLEKEKERQQMQDRQERARILKESAQLAKDAVNQHFTESLRRMPHSAATSPSIPVSMAMMNMWNKQGYMGAGDIGQPQDLSLNSKNKEQQRLESIVRQEKERELAHQAAAQLMPQNHKLAEEKQKAMVRQQEALIKSIQAGTSGQEASSQARLVDEHFLKAGLSSQMASSTKSEHAAAQAAYSLYGYQSQAFPHKFVSKDQLQQQLCKDEKLDKDQLQQQLCKDEKLDKFSLKSLPGMDATKRMSQATPPRTTTAPTEPAGSHTSYSNQLIQEGLIPNPAYAPHGSVASNAPTNNASNSMSALVNMSMHAGSHIADRYNKDKSPTVKTEPTVASRNSQPPVTSTTISSSNPLQPSQVKSFKSFVENAVTEAFYKDIEEQEKKSPTRSPPMPSSIKLEKMSNGTMDTDSDTLSAPSPTQSIKTDGQDSKPCHPKMRLKKEWLQRHAEGGAGCPTSSSSPTSAASGNLLNSSTASNLSETTTSASETESEQQGGVQRQKSKKRKSDTSLSNTNGQSKKSKNCEVSSGLLNKNMSRSSGSSLHMRSGSSEWPAAGGDDYTQCSYNDEQDSIKQMADIADQADRMEEIPYANKPLVRVNIATLKRTLEPFVQDGSCIEMAPKLSKCRECKMTPNQRNKKIPNIFCRFYAFRQLKFSKHGQISIAGFCDPSEAEPDDITIWLPHITAKNRLIDKEEVKTAKYIISNVGEEFCRLVEQEQECVSWSGNKRAWKRAVQGVREMCDVCDTTLFNTHWVCHRCGFVVCIDCYRVKRKIQTRNSSSVCEENRRWLSCTTSKNHEADKLMLTSIIPADALKIARNLIHHVRRKHNIKASCSCSPDRQESVDSPTHITNGGEKQPEPELASTANIEPKAINGQSYDKLSLSYPQDVYRQSTYLSSSLDNKTLNTYSDDPLSLLADVAAMAPTTSAPPVSTEARMNGGSNVEEMDTCAPPEGGEKKPCTTLRKLLTKTQANGSVVSDKKVHEMVNTVVDPASQQPLKSHMPAGWDPSQHEFAHYQRRSGAYLSGRAQAIPICYLKETSLLYPDVKHSWLCEGKLLRLLNPQHPKNFELFTQRWTLGQPVIVSNVSKHMSVEELWTPKAFSKEFGHVRHDLIDCRRNEPLSGYQIKCFWDGFEDQSKRLTDNEGQPLILKLKDWPTAEDFAESMPSRFQDLMSALPMPQYTQRNGVLNLAGRLPEFFVKPDLGPKMYIAYGLAKYPQSGTTNLHLDVSDAVNVMVFVAHEEHLEENVMQLIDDSDCDELMKRRVTEDHETPGALWHIYDACDADKMRDLLNKVALELGMELEPYHDPIHDQQFYLDRNLRQRLADEYGVYGYPILQCVGDAVFIPAGAPHQVQNLNGCIKVAEDFVSPEHLHHCFNLTQEFRHLSNTHANHEDKLQVKNIIYHAIKDAVAVLDQSEPLS